jgi:MFS transporter, putative metabolite:H+ symporter
MPGYASVGARLDGLPLSGFHWRMLGLIAAGMYFDSFDIYIAGTVLAAMIHSGESTLSLNAAFVSITFIGMMTGARLSGVLGDRFGRRFCYQFNLGKPLNRRLPAWHPKRSRAVRPRRSDETGCGRVRQE